MADELQMPGWVRRSPELREAFLAGMGEGVKTMRSALRHQGRLTSRERRALRDADGIVEGFRATSSILREVAGG